MKLKKHPLIKTLMSLLVCLILVGCQTVQPTPPQIPELTVIRPDRPQLTGTYEEMLKSLLVYTFSLEEYCNVVDDYLAEINSMYVVDDK